MKSYNTRTVRKYFHFQISDETKNTIMQAVSSFLFSEDQAWIKRNGGTFDVTMGGFHGAEICELVGLYLLSQLTLSSIGLYRDDGLAVSPSPHDKSKF